MDQQTILQLNYRRQYLVAPVNIECPYSHNRYYLNDDYTLYAHTDLKVDEYKRGYTRIIILGEIFDFNNTRYSNKQILQNLMNDSFDKVLKDLGSYAGRYAIIFISKSQLFMVHDATSLRKVYYHFNESGCWCSSQPRLLAEIVNVEKTNNQSVISYYGSALFRKLNNAGIGDITIYENIRQLMPNHYLNLLDKKVKRFWPFEYMPTLDPDEAAAKIAPMIKGFIHSIDNRHEIMMPVTAGKDSRTLLAGSKNISDHVFYYINKEKTMSENSIDIKIPRKLISKLGRKFHILDINIEVDKDFETIYYRNYEFASSKYLPVIYNYYRNYVDRINMPGVFAASAYELYGSDERFLNEIVLARLNWAQQFDFAIDYYRQWLNETAEICNKFNFNKLALFYWEERIANWGTQLQQFKDIAQEEYIPFNCRTLIQLCFSVEPKWLNKPNYSLYRKIMDKLWSDVLMVPINPDLKHKVFRILEYFKLMESARKIKHKFTHSTKM